MTLRQSSLVRSALLLVLAGMLAACCTRVSEGGSCVPIQPTPGPSYGGQQNR